MRVTYEYRQEQVRALFERIKVNFSEWLFQCGFWEIGANRDMIMCVESAINEVLEKIAIRNALGDVCEKLPHHTVLLHGMEGSGKRTLARKACEWLKSAHPQAVCEMCDFPFECWQRERVCPVFWRVADVLVLGEFLSKHIGVDYAADLRDLLKERKWNGKVTILTTRSNSYASALAHLIEMQRMAGYVGNVGLEDDWYSYLIGDLTSSRVGVVEDENDRLKLVQNANVYFKLGMPECALNQVAQVVCGPTRDIINQVRCVGKFAEENPAVPLTANVASFALKETVL